MKTLIFSGVSDNLLEIEGDEWAEFSANGRTAVKLVSDEGQMIITAIYAHKLVNAGVWNIGIAPVDEGVSIPPWNFECHLAESGYSPVLTVDCPDDTRIIEISSS